MFLIKVKKVNSFIKAEKLMVSNNLFIFMDKYLNKEKKNHIKQFVNIKVFDRNIMAKL